MSEGWTSLDRVLRMADGLAAALRRRPEREPRVVVYDAGGRARALTAEAAGYEALLEVAREMVTIGDRA